MKENSSCYFTFREKMAGANLQEKYREGALKLWPEPVIQVETNGSFRRYQGKRHKVQTRAVIRVQVILNLGGTTDRYRSP